jgi:N-acetyl sugar amidotransferase
MNDKKYQICTKTIMDTVADNEIIFDENGVCNYVKEYEEMLGIRVPDSDIAAQKLEAALVEIRNAGKNSDYDCVMGVSGGTDSTYLAYLIKKVWNLRPLAVHLDNGWNSELAVSNIEKTLNVLGVDLYTHVLDWDEFKDLQLSFLKASVPDGEIPTDHAITALLYHTAAKHNIKYIISGTNVRTEGIMPRSWSDGHLDFTYIRKIQKAFGTKKLKTYIHLTLFSYFKYILFKRIKKVAFLDFIEYDKPKVVEFLQKELGWRDYGGKHYESIYTRFFQGYVLPEKFSIDKRRAHASTLVCSGLMTREAALEEMKHSPYPTPAMLEEDKQFVFKKLEITPTEFNNIMKLPLKAYTDYPNNSKVLNYLWSLYNLVRKRQTRERN